MLKHVLKPISERSYQTIHVVKIGSNIKSKMKCFTDFDICPKIQVGRINRALFHFEKNRIVADGYGTGHFTFRIPIGPSDLDTHFRISDRSVPACAY